MATISNGTITVTPTGIMGVEARRASRSVEHDIIDRADPDVTLRPASPRRGVLRLLFLDYGDALTAETMHAGASVFTLAPDVTDPEPIEAMTYVLAPGGDVTRTNADDTASMWHVDVAYLERP